MATPVSYLRPAKARHDRRNNYDAVSSFERWKTDYERAIVLRVLIGEQESAELIPVAAS